MLEEAQAQARRILRHMPEEVFELWFDERVSSLGWPPAGTRWDGVLREMSLSQWRQLRWTKQPVVLDQSQLHPGTIHIINGLTEAYFVGIPNAYSADMGTGSIVKLQRILQYIGEYHQLPSTLIFVKKGHLYDIVDGCHRLTAYLNLRAIPAADEQLPDAQVSWVGAIDSSLP